MAGAQQPGIFFDMGGVLLNDRRLRARACEVFHNIDHDEVWTRINDAFLPACRGEEPLAAGWRRMAADLDVDVEDDVLDRLWIEDYEEGIDIDQQLMRCFPKLREQAALGVISNTVHEHAEVNRRLGVYEPFEQVILSHEVGMTKDDPRIFELALQKFNAEPASCVFIDDIPRYAELASSLGMTGITFKSLEQLTRDLRKAGFDLT